MKKLKVLLATFIVFGLFSCEQQRSRYLVINKDNSPYPILCDSVKMIDVKHIIIYSKGLKQELFTDTKFVVISNY